MTWDELVEVGARALYGEGEEGPSLEAEQRREGCRTLAEEVLEAVSPLIRADEREQYQGRRDGMMRALSTELLHVRTKTLTDLRAKARALYDAPPESIHDDADLVEALLALIDGSRGDDPDEGAELLLGGT